jgi:hypothetical protein
MGLESAGTAATLDRYIGYWKPYATGHNELDSDTALQAEVQFAARMLAEKMTVMRMHRSAAAEQKRPPREK